MKFRYEDLEVSGLILDFIDQTAEMTKHFPPDERFGLVSQIRRAATSVLLNLAEGSARHSGPDFGRFITMSLGSLVETHAAMRISLRRQLISQQEWEAIQPSIHRIWRMLCGLRQSQNNWMGKR